MNYGLKVEKGLKECYNPFKHLDILYIAVDTKEIIFNGAIYNSFRIKDIDKEGVIYIDTGKGKLLQCRIPNASENSPGLMTAIQYKQLDYLYNLIQDNQISLDYNDIKNKPTALSQFDNDLNFVDGSTLDSIVSNLNDLYAQKNWVIEQIQDFNVFDPNLYYTKQIIDDNFASKIWVEQQSYLTQQDIGNKVNISDLKQVAFSGNYNDLINRPVIPTIPSKISYFVNDVGYLTQHQSLSDYATKNWVTEQIIQSENFDPLLYYTKTEIDNKGYLTQHQSLAQYALKSELFSGSYDDLTNKPVIPEVPVISTNINTDSNSDIKTVSPKAVKTYVDNSIPDTTNFIQKSQTSGLLRNDGSIDQTSYLTQQDIDGKAEKSEMGISVNGDETTITLKNGTSTTVINSHQTVATVATSGSYNDLSNKPIIPTITFRTWTS